jgi:cellulose 1,4-beta-cellobiosidase
MKKNLKKRIGALTCALAMTVSMFGYQAAFAAEAHVDNPYIGATAYVNPDYAALIDTSISQVSDSTLAAKMETVKSYPTAVWLDRIVAIHGGEQNGGRRSLAGHLDLALAQKEPGTPITIELVIYNMPGRDCHALASNGELPLTQAALEIYKQQYIDAIAEVLADPKYQDIRIVTVIEPDGLPNLVTNMSDPECAQASSSGIYVSAVQYAINKLNEIPNVYIYMDIGHSGWLGWDNNRSGAVQLYTNVVKGTRNGLSSVDGFITNTANSTPLEEPNLPNSGLNINGAPIRSSDFYEWNPYFDETDFTAALYNDFVNAGWPSDIGFLIDTSRNGWGGPNRPSVATGSDINSYVNSGRVDRREHRGLWCNNAGAGMGMPPQAAPAGSPQVDAYVWVKPPGESDGSSSLIPNNEGKGFDRMCDPTYMTPDGVLSGALPNAPVSGHWFHDQFVMLVQNAYPAVPTSNNEVPTKPSAPAGLSAQAGNGQVALSWNAVSGATSYTVKRATINGGPYTTVATNVMATSYTNTGLTNGTTYDYVVSAVNSAGESVDSTQASATPQTTVTVPAAPSGLTAAAGDKQVSLSWNAVSGATSYNVKRAATNGGPYTTVAANVMATSYTNTGLTNGTTYYYVVSAVNSAGESVNSTQVSAAPQATVTVPSAPSGLTAAAGDKQVALSWNAVSGATSYNVKRAATNGGPYTTVAANVTATSFANTGLANGTTYYYVVSAVNSAGESANSAQVSATPQGTSTPSGDLVVQYRAADTNATDNQIKPNFNIKNTGTSPVNLSELKLRYYFSQDGGPSMNSWIDWAQIGGSNIERTFTDSYVELSFTAGAGSIAANGQSGDIQLRMSKNDWSNFNEANDYSFDATKTSYTNWDKVTLYQNGTLVWGVEP